MFLLMSREGSIRKGLVSHTCEQVFHYLFQLELENIFSSGVVDLGTLAKGQLGKGIPLQACSSLVPVELGKVSKRSAGQRNLHTSIKFRLIRLTIIFPPVDDDVSTIQKAGFVLQSSSKFESATISAHQKKQYLKFRWKLRNGSEGPPGMIET